MTMEIRITENGRETWCGPYLEWYRHHSVEPRTNRLICEAIRSGGRVVHSSSLDFPDKLVSVQFWLMDCPGHGSEACSVCEEAPGNVASQPIIAEGL